MSEFTQIPSIESLLESKAFEKLTKAHGRDLVLRAMRATVNEIRENIKKGGKSESDAGLASNVGKRIEAWTKPTLLPVINASGVILHTNLGRAPLCDEAVNAIVETASSYCTLEYNLTKGERGNREVHAAELLKLITGAEVHWWSTIMPRPYLLCLWRWRSRAKCLCRAVNSWKSGARFVFPTSCV